MSNTWYEIIIEDELELSGFSVFNILSILFEIDRNFEILVCNLEGANVESIVNNKKYVSEELPSLLGAVKSASQFDWCDFFCYKENSVLSENVSYREYPLLIEKSIFTLRCVDNCYFYLYFKELDKEMLMEILKLYKRIKIEEVDLRGVSYSN